VEDKEEITYGLLNGMIANDLEWVWRLLLLLEAIVSSAYSVRDGLIWREAASRGPSALAAILVEVSAGHRQHTHSYFNFTIVRGQSNWRFSGFLKKLFSPLALIYFFIFFQWSLGDKLSQYLLDQFSQSFDQMIGHRWPIWTSFLIPQDVAMATNQSRKIGVLMFADDARN